MKLIDLHTIHPVPHPGANDGRGDTLLFFAEKDGFSLDASAEHGCIVRKDGRKIWIPLTNIRCGEIAPPPPPPPPPPPQPEPEPTKPASPAARKK